MIGTTLGHYVIAEKIGAGGMGDVYRARDTTLDRDVALKILPPDTARDPERRQRFEREAKAVAALKHPNIVTIHTVEEIDGIHFLTMELVEGKRLDRLIPRAGLGRKQFFDLAGTLAEGVAAAHARGVIHRDLKPANIMVSVEGRLKILDFGLAKLRGPALPGVGETQLPTATLTQDGRVVGTAAYMSPEQAEGKSLDARSDVFSLGVVLYEMLTGERPFQGDSWVSTLSAVVQEVPRPPKTLRADISSDVERIVLRCLEKRPSGRYPSAAELGRELAESRSRMAESQVGLQTVLRRRRLALPALLLLLALLALAGLTAIRSSRVRWAREEALPEIELLARTQNHVDAFYLARQAARYLPDDPTLRRLLLGVSSPVSIHTTPPGADISIKEYKAVDSEWHALGRSPLDDIRLPRSNLRWMITMEGFETAEFALPALAVSHFTLELQRSVPRGMVRVPGRPFEIESGERVEVQPYWIDRYEVTNLKFKEFVDVGGYENEEYWEHPFVDAGRPLSREEAMAVFVDATGRRGPSTWRLGSYLEGEGDYPVRGISWYEAAAYARFAGKSLPTIHDWQNAAGFGHFSDILKLSNFGGERPAAVGAHHGLGPFGTYDMAGNVKEWCWNRTGDRRYILGGAWNEPAYTFRSADAKPPLERSETYGLRCVEYAEPPPAFLTEPIEALALEFGSIEPVEDRIFQIYRDLHSYDRAELDARIESVDESAAHWRKETVSFRAAYGNERVLAHLLVPRDAPPPYQTVVYFPTGSARHLRSSEYVPDLVFIDFIPRSGRALLYPVYRGTYERLEEVSLSGPRARRDMIIDWSKDLARSIDYLESRPDIDGARIAFMGISMGANYAPIFLAVETRLKAAVLISAGFHTHMLELPPEVQPWHYAPRVRLPVLLVGTRHDFIFPVETSQRPLFRLLGTVETDKRHALLDGGHVPPMNDVVREALDWLDRYLGPVAKRR